MEEEKEEEMEEEAAGASEPENCITREKEREPEKGVLKGNVKRISRKSVVLDALPIHPKTDA